MKSAKRKLIYFLYKCIEFNPLRPNVLIHFYALAVAAALRRLNRSKCYEGIQLVAFPPCETDSLCEVECALDLIRQTDPRRFHRIDAHVRRIFLAQYNPRFTGGYSDLGRVCHLRALEAHHSNARYKYSATLVHEATHALLNRRKFPYTRANSKRIERLCADEAARFLRHLPADPKGISPERVCSVDSSFSRPTASNIVVNQNYLQRFRSTDELRKAAEHGDPQAQSELGWLYHSGKIVTRDYSMALFWYRKAAESREPTALNRIGVCYENGEGVEKDISKAVEWYRRAAELGDSKAQDNLGLCYSKGAVTPEDHKEAVKWYSLSAEQGYHWAQYHLGYCYEAGYGVPANPAEALRWYRLSADQNNLEAQNEIGRCYTEGRGVTKDPNEAFRWFLRAAKQGHDGAQFNLGLCYEEGAGVPQSLSEAIKWFRSAADQGVPEAKAKVSQIRLEQ